MIRTTKLICPALLTFGMTTSAMALDIGIGVDVGDIGVDVGVGIGGGTGTGAAPDTDAGDTGTGHAATGLADVNVTAGTDRKRANARATLRGGRLDDGHGLAAAVSLGTNTATPDIGTVDDPTDDGVGTSDRAGLGGDANGPQSLARFDTRLYLGTLVYSNDRVLLGVVRGAEPAPGGTVDLRVALSDAVTSREASRTLRVASAAQRRERITLNLSSGQFISQSGL